MSHLSDGVVVLILWKPEVSSRKAWPCRCNACGKAVSFLIASTTTCPRFTVKIGVCPVAPLMPLIAQTFFGSR